MKDKHIHVAEDSALLRLINEQVRRSLPASHAGGNRLLVFKFLFYALLAILFYVLLFKVESPLLFVLVFMCYGFTAILLAFNFAHDLSHNTIFRSRRLNEIGFTVLYALVGAHAQAWKHRHIHSHHYAPNVEDYDSDMKITNLIRVIPGRPHAWYHRFQHWYAPLAYTSYSIFWVFIKDFVILFSKEETRKKHWSYYLSFIAQKIFYISYLVVLPAALSKQPFYMVLVGFLSMHLFQSLFLLFTFFITHHVEATHYPTTDEQGYISCSWLTNQVKSSNDFYPFSRTANFIFGGFNNHIAHHLFPHVRSIYYPELSRVLYDVLIIHGIRPNQTGYFGGVISHLRLLQLMSKDK